MCAAWAAALTICRHTRPAESALGAASGETAARGSDRGADRAAAAEAAGMRRARPGPGRRVGCADARPAGADPASGDSQCLSGAHGSAGAREPGVQLLSGQSSWFAGLTAELTSRALGTADAKDGGQTRCAA